jgi:hypothetical protein
MHVFKQRNKHTRHTKMQERELFEAEHLHAETQAEREEEKEEKRRQTEQALDWASTGRTCLERSLSTLKDENKRLIGLLRESEVCSLTTPLMRVLVKYHSEQHSIDLFCSHMVCMFFTPGSVSSVRGVRA